MSSSGSGTGQAISSGSQPVLGIGTTTAVCLSLPDYARIVEYDEHRFFGVNRQDFLDYQCREFWSQGQRNTLLHYIAVAQDMIEVELSYPLCPRWFADEVQDFESTVRAKSTRLISPGVMAVADIALETLADHSNDPAQVGPIATAVSDVNEVHVYHPGTDIEILPQQMQIKNGELTLWMPRCRMVILAQQVSEEQAEYSNLAHFESQVDVKRVYNDASIQAELVWHRKSGVLGEDVQTAYVQIEVAETGHVSLLPASFDGGVWRRVGLLKRTLPNQVRLNYRAGITAVSPGLKDAVHRLAHSLMPEAPCGCDHVNSLWRRDRNVPNILDRERLNCPFGMSDGAWFAWRAAQRNRVVRFGNL